MRFLLIDASSRRLVANDPTTARPAASNGSVIGEIGGRVTPSGQTTPERFRSVLGTMYPCPAGSTDPGAPEPCTPDLPEFDIQFDPQGLENVGSVKFTITRNGTEIGSVIDNFAPYSVGGAEDGFFQMPDQFDEAGLYTLKAEAFSLDDAGGVSEGMLTIEFRITNNPLVRTELSRKGQEREAEAEAETEVEAMGEAGIAAGSLAVAAAAAARGAGSVTQALVSGAVSLRTLPGPDVRVPRGRIDEVTCPPNPCPLPPAPLPTEQVAASGQLARPSAEGEAEAEVESEAEAEVGLGSASAVAGTSVAVSATGVTSYLTRGGQTRAVAAESIVAVDGGSSTSTALSPVETGPTQFPSEKPGATKEDTPSEGTVIESAQPIDAQPGAAAQPAPEDYPVSLRPVAQLDTEAEVEVETEAEAEAEAGIGAAAAAASGGAGVAVVGDFAAAAAHTSVATVTATNTVRREIPKVFTDESALLPVAASPVVDPDPERPAEDADENPEPTQPTPSGSADPGAPPNPVQQGLYPVPVSTTGTGPDFDRTNRGLFEAEAEAEAEAEVEVDLDNGSAAVACVASGGGGSTGLGATSRVAAITSASAMTVEGPGVMRRTTDVGSVCRTRETTRTAEFGRGATAETDALAEAHENRDPAAPPNASTCAEGDVTSSLSLTLQGRSKYGEAKGTTETGTRDVTVAGPNPRPANGTNKLVGNPDGNFEVEVEADGVDPVAWTV